MKTRQIATVADDVLQAAQTLAIFAAAAAIPDDVLQAARELDKSAPVFARTQTPRPQAVADNEILIYGVVGDSYDGLDAKSVVDRIGAIGDDAAEIVVRINSGGGLVFDGLAIFNALARHKAPKTVMVDGIAASMASVIAMVGDKILCPENAMIMIHDPWNIAIGNADDMRANADFLDRCKASILGIYQDRTGLDAKTLSKLMSAETWMNGREAVEQGFATDTGKAEVDAAALLRPSLAHLNLKNLPGALLREKRQPQSAIASAKTPAQQTESNKMDKKSLLALAAALGIAVTAQIDKVIEDLVAGAADMTKALAELSKFKPDATQAATDAERTRAEEIRKAVATAKLKPELADKLVKDGVSLDAARAQIIDAMADDANRLPENRTQIVVGADARDKFREGATASIAARAGYAKDDPANNYRGATLQELARASLEAAGIRTAGMDRMKMVRAAMTGTTSDFPYILENIAHKAMMKGYEDAAETFQKWTSTGVLTDFKTASRVDLTAFPSLGTVAEGAEYKYASMGDRKEPITLATYGNLFTISRPAIINDDLSAFTRVPNKMGRAAIRTVGDLVYAILTGNPAMADGTTLFHANHKNLSGSSDAISVTSVDAARVGMAIQKDRKATSVSLNVRPRFGLCPVGKGGLFRQLVASTYDPSKSTFVANPVANLVEVIDDARLDAASATAWYLAADPNVTDTIEVAYLDGVQTPSLEQMEGWKQDGIEFKVRIDAAVKAIAWEGLYKNPGA